MLFTILSIWLIDKIGRKMLLIIGSSVMAICLIGTGFLFGMNEINGALVLVFLLVYVAAFAISFGTVAYVIISEVFPTYIRGLAASVATFFLYVGQFLVAQFFPVLISSVGSSATFYVFAFFSILSLIFTIFVVPETKGKSLEEIENANKKVAN
ncbi:MFS transporter [Peribacillus frigoritolerans]|uniref:MFS transporter n=1 Tax=Peribacillus frigoritolerans TaxID=450367 RepID=UPI00289309D0|nr:MFS transporter [Peribacillus frigoritolerans]